VTSKRNSDANIKNQEVESGSNIIIIIFSLLFIYANICEYIRT